MSFKVDFSKMKKVSSDEHHTIMRHPEGHEIKIAHSALSRPLRQQLKKLPMHEEHIAMAKGGDVPAPEDDLSDIIPSEAISSSKDDLSDVMPTSSSSGGPLEVEAMPQEAAIPKDISLPKAEPMQVEPMAEAQPKGAEPMPQSYGDIYKTGVSGIRQEASAAAAGEKQKAEIAGNYAKTQSILSDTFQKEYQDYKQEMTHLIDDYINQHIDPSRYVGSMDYGQKTMTAIGLALGGFGAGVTGGPNQALQFLNQNIERDIEAQKAELGKRETLLSLNLKRFGNMKDATQMTTLMMAEKNKADMEQATARAGEGIAKGRGQQLVAQMAQQILPAEMQFNMRQAMMKGVNSGADVDSTIHYANLLGMKDEAKYLEERYVPNAGMAKSPVPAEDRRNLIAKNTLNKMATEFYQWVKDHSGELSLYAPADVAKGQTMAAELQSLYRNAINGGVFKKGEQEFIDHIIDSDPTKFFNEFRVLPKIKAVIESNREQINQLHSGFGLPQKYGKTKEGKWVMRGPKGEAVFLE